MIRATCAPAALLAALVLGSSAEAAETVVPNYAKADTQRWRCRLCPFDLASSKEASWTLGAIHVDGANARFGRDSGLTESGAVADLDLAYRRRDDDGRRLEARAGRVGLDSRAMRVVFGGQRSSLRLDRRDVPRNTATDVATPFMGRAALRLPSDWMRSFDTARMSDWGNRRFDDATVRRRTTVEVKTGPRPDWWIKAGYSRETKSGTERTFADFLYQSTGLPKPVEYLTEEVAASTGVERGPAIVAAEFRTARFRNRIRSLAWQNPWRGPVATRGSKALAPDGESRSLMLVSRLAIGNRASADATLTWGEARQDDIFEPYTTNRRLDTEPLPANSPDARATSFAATVNLVARPTDRLRLIARHRERERDNRTAPLTFVPVRGEAFSLGPVASRAYDVARSVMELGVAYRVAPRVRVGIYGDSTRMRRRPAEVSANEERRYRFEANVGGWRGLRARLSLGDARRDAAEFRDTTDNNPLTRRYHQAAREQRYWQVRLGYDATRSGASFAVLAECRQNRYPESMLGLQRDGNCAQGVDIGYSPPARKLSLAAYHFEQETDASTTGRIGYAGADWRYVTADAVATSGLRFEVEELAATRLDLRLDVVRSHGAGRYLTERGGRSLPFPTLVSTTTALDVHARYTLGKRTTMLLQLRHERHAGADWAEIEAVDAIRNVLAFGGMPPRYGTTMIGLAYAVTLGGNQTGGGVDP